VVEVRAQRAAKPLIEVHESPEDLARSVAGALLTRLAEIQASGREPQIGLTGGTIADAMHRELARMADSFEVDWSRVVIWFGDERFVPAGSPERNAGQARAAFLDAVGATRAYAVPSADEVATAEDAAEAYSTTIKEHGRGGFDVLMLGIGPDGHVASLFPGHPALACDDKIACAVHDSPKPPPDRVTLTFGALARATEVWFLASGEGKADAVAAAIAEHGTVEQTPARGVTGLSATVWHLDRDSASHL